MLLYFIPILLDIDMDIDLLCQENVIQSLQMVPIKTHPHSNDFDIAAARLEELQVGAQHLEGTKSEPWMEPARKGGRAVPLPICKRDNI